MNVDRDDIFEQLHKIAGVCMTCGESRCPHGSNTTLPSSLSTDDVLQAINHAFDKQEPTT